MTIPKTRFIEVLEQIHQSTNERYGQIINNAYQIRFGRNDHPGGGACYDTFHIYDEEFTQVLLDYLRYLQQDSKPGEYIQEGKNKK